MASNRALKRLIESNFCLVNGVTERFASRKLKAGDQVKWQAPASSQFTGKQQFEAHRILFEDEACLIYDKPAGVTSDAHGILALLKPHGTYYLTHRLDKDTTGVLLLAKTPQAEAALADAFRRREIHKEYLALVDGCPKEPEGVIEDYLGKKGAFHGQTLYGRVPKERGRYAKTHWVLIKAAARCALISCFPETGRTHQLRVHLSGLGHPVLGDYQYGKEFQFKIRPQRMLLHASALRFIHPVTKAHLEAVAPLPDDFNQLMRQLW
jgi:23S rRNA pseudouridine955/2504/2580 synthase/23S rRNA pseudouridine1911/1915/1917 synthase